MDGRVHGWVDGWMIGSWVDRWMVGLMGRYFYRSVNGGLGDWQMGRLMEDGQMDGQVDGQIMEGWMDGYVGESWQIGLNLQIGIWLDRCDMIYRMDGWMWMIRER